MSLTTMTWGAHHPHRIASHCIASHRLASTWSLMRRCVLRFSAFTNSVSQGVPGCWYRAHKPQRVMSTSLVVTWRECRNTSSGTRNPTIPPIDTFFLGPHCGSPARPGQEQGLSVSIHSARTDSGVNPLAASANSGFPLPSGGPVI